MATLSGSPVRSARARCRAVSSSQARRFTTPVSGSVVAAVRRVRARRPCTSVNAITETTTTSQAAVKCSGRAATAPIVARTTSRPACARATVRSKKCAA
jgi:hypothetical protein